MWSVTAARPSYLRIWGSDVSKSKAKAKTPEPAPRPILKPLRGAAFEKDVKRLKKGGKDMEKLRTVIDRLCSGEPLEPRHNDHPLTGQWKGLRDCHIEPIGSSFTGKRRAISSLSVPAAIPSYSGNDRRGPAGQRSRPALATAAGRVDGSGGRAPGGAPGGRPGRAGGGAIQDRAKVPDGRCIVRYSRGTISARNLRPIRPGQPRRADRPDSIGRGTLPVHIRPATD